MKNVRAVRPGRPDGAAVCGFTLIELLVVVSIIALLTSLTLPNLRSAMARARSLKCQAALRTIGQAVQMYVDDRQGYLPPVATDWGASGVKHYWVQFLAPYTGVPLDPNSRAKPTPTPPAWSPQEKLEQQWWGAFPKDNVYWGCPEWRREQPNAAVSRPGYGMNGYLRSPTSGASFTGDSKNPIRYQAVTYASARVLVADAPDWHVRGLSNFNNGYYGFQDYSQGSPIRHGDRANYLFCDLSVRAVSYLRAHMALYDPQQFKEE